MYIKTLEEKIHFFRGLADLLEEGATIENALRAFKDKRDQEIINGYEEPTEKVKEFVKEALGIDPDNYQKVPVYRNGINYDLIREGLENKLPFYAILAGMGFENNVVQMVMAAERFNFLPRSLRIASDGYCLDRQRQLLDESSLFELWSELRPNGIPILDELKMLVNSTNNMLLRGASDQIYRDIREGNSISASMARNEGIFDEYTIRVMQRIEHVNPDEDQPISEQKIDHVSLIKMDDESAKLLRQLAQYKRSLVNDQRYLS